RPSGRRSLESLLLRGRPGTAGLAQRAHCLLALILAGPVEDQHSVEMVHLVLDHARLEARGLDQDLAAALVASAHSHMKRALHVDRYAGKTETGFLEQVLLVGCPLETR